MARVVHALGALDIALWDLRGKAEGMPCWRLWADHGRDQLTPYASLQPESDSYDTYLDSIVPGPDGPPRRAFGR